MNEKKITLATVKSFIRKNSDKLFIKVRGKFDAMTDGMEFYQNAGFSQAEKTDSQIDHTMGVNGAWMVSGSRNYVDAYNEDGFTGYRISNCCALFILAVKS